MVQARLTILLAGLCLLASSCAVPKESIKTDRFSYRWEKAMMTGSRTGVTAVVGSGVQKALGRVSADGSYTSPSGRIFAPGTSTALAAAALISYQDTMAPLREVIGHSAEEMPRGGINCALYAWTADALKLGVESELGCEVDAAVMNKGGIRVDMPAGDVTVDDISSMFPFLNYLTYVEVPGTEMRKLLQFFAAGNFQAISGIEMRVKDGSLVEATIGGRPLDDADWYRIATVDYLLDGGDHIYLARNSRKLVISKHRMLDWMKKYVASLEEQGKVIECKDFTRVIEL